MTAFSGHIYGVVLNDVREREVLQPAFMEAPYGKPPVAPVVFMKPRVCLNRWSPANDAAGPWQASTCLALLFAEDATCCTEAQVDRVIGATALAIDLSRPQPNYYRPSIAMRNEEGTLALSDWSGPTFPAKLDLMIDGKQAHSWQLNRLARPVHALVSEISLFLTLKAGDVLLVGLPGDAPTVTAGQSLVVEAEGMPRAGMIFAEVAA